MLPQGEILPKNEARNKQNKKFVGDTERGMGERGEREKLSPDNIIWV